MESKEKIIKTIIDDISSGNLLLPHFQRDFDWKPDKQKDLIASFLYNIPIGSILLLQTNTATDMTTKKIGYKEPENQKNSNQPPKSYLMDGQQRLTTLKSVFDDFFKESEDNEIFNKLYHNLKYRWFLKLNIFSQGDMIEESHLRIILDLIYKREISDDRSVSDVKDLISQLQIHKSRPEKPYHPEALRKNKSDFRNFLEKNQFLGLFLLLPTTKTGSLSREYTDLLKDPTQKIFEEEWLKKLQGDTKIQFIKILKEYEKEELDFNNSDQIKRISRQWADDLYDALRHLFTESRKLFTVSYGDSFSKAVEAFTAMNKGGLPLSTFDIIVAKYSALQDSKPLKERIIEKFKEFCKEHTELLPKIECEKIFNHFPKDQSSETQKFYNQYLNMLSILSSKNNNESNNLQSDHIKEKKKLSLTKKEINEYTDESIHAIALAFRFLSGYCGVSRITDISYQLMILPIAKSLYDKTSSQSLISKNIYKILHWYWSAIFSGRYREKQNSRAIEDIKNLKKILDNESSNVSSKKVFSDTGYSDLESLKNNDTPALKNPIMQFIFINKILNENCKNPEDVISKLEKGDFEISHLISLDDYNKKTTQQIKRNSPHYINSVLNLSLLSKDINRFDRSKSWYEWNQDKLKKENILIPEKINRQNWDEFSKSAKNADYDQWEKLCESFLECRFKEIKKTVENRLEALKQSWKK